nr:MAG TPA: hypothetical protein [Caudoviricetes sp.]
MYLPAPCLGVGRLLAYDVKSFLTTKSVRLYLIQARQNV